jgi:hypothetical protein
MKLCLLVMLGTVTTCYSLLAQQHIWHDAVDLRAKGENYVVDDRLRRALAAFWQSDSERSCIYEVCFLPRDDRVTLIVVRRIPFLSFYTTLDEPLISFCLDNHTVFLYTGGEKYLRNRESQVVIRGDTTWECCPFQSRVFKDSLGIITDYRGRIPITPFPPLSVPTPGEVVKRKTAKKSR